MLKHAKLGLALALSLTLGSQIMGQAQTDGQKEKSEKSKSHIAIVIEGKRLGIIGGFLSKDRIEKLKLGEKRGVLVREVIKDSTADRAGLKSNDVIIEVDGQAIESHNELRNKLQKLDYGKPYNLKIIRDGNPQQLNFTLDKSDQDNAYAYAYGNNSEELKKAFEKAKEARKKALEDSRQSFEKRRAEREKERAERRARGEKDYEYFSFDRPRLGIQTQELNDQLGKYFGAENGKGVLVSYVSENAAGAKAGLQAGDIIISINNLAISNSRELRKEISKIEAGDVTITVLRNHQRIDLRATLEPKAKIGEGFNFEFSHDFPNSFLESFDGKVMVAPGAKDMFNIHILPSLHIPDFNLDSLSDIDFYL